MPGPGSSCMTKCKQIMDSSLDPHETWHKLGDERKENDTGWTEGSGTESFCYKGGQDVKNRFGH
jgi:hypothetical protein